MDKNVMSDLAKGIAVGMVVGAAALPIIEKVASALPELGSLIDGDCNKKLLPLHDGGEHDQKHREHGQDHEEEIQKALKFYKEHQQSQEGN